MDYVGGSSRETQTDRTTEMEAKTVGRKQEKRGDRGLRKRKRETVKTDAGNSCISLYPENPLQ